MYFDYDNVLTYICTKIKSCVSDIIWIYFKHDTEGDHTSEWLEIGRKEILLYQDRRQVGILYFVC